MKWFILGIIIMSVLDYTDVMNAGDLIVLLVELSKTTVEWSKTL